MTNFPTSLIERPEVIDQSIGERGDAALRTLGERGFMVVMGLTPDYIKEIKRIAESPSISEFCPKDAVTRFGSVPIAEKWIAKGGFEDGSQNGRAMFVLVDQESNEVAGYNWEGVEPSITGPITTAYRLNPEYTRRGLAVPFAQAMLSTGRRIIAPDLSPVGLETWKSNTDAANLYSKLGFYTIHESEEELRPTLDIHSPDVVWSKGKPHKRDVRVYMRIPDDLL